MKCERKLQDRQKEKSRRDWGQKDLLKKREKWFKQNFRKRENRNKHKNKVEKKDFLAEKIDWLQVKK